MKLISIMPFWKYFSFYYKYLGFKIYCFIALSFVAGLFESLGVASIIPLISSIGHGENQQNDTFSRITTDIFELLGVSPAINSILFTIIVVFFMKSVVVFWVDVIKHYLLKELIIKLQTHFARAFNAIRYKFYIETDIGYFNNIITTECGGAVAGFKKVSLMVTGGCSLLVFLLSAMLVSYQTTIFVLVCGVVTHYLYRSIRIKVANYSKEKSKSNAYVQNLFLQFIYNFKYLKTISGGKILLRKIVNEIEVNSLLLFKNSVLNSFTSASYDFSKILVLTSMIYFFVEVEQRSFASLVVLLLLTNKCLALLTQIQSDWQQLCSISGSFNVLEKADKLLIKNRDIASAQQILLPNFSNKILLNHITYCFDKDNVFTDIDITIRKHDCIGFAGRSGSGKTTLLDIVTGLLYPSGGEISIDGINYNNLDMDKMRKLFGYVTQDPVIFNDTIANNISLWNYNQNDSEDQQKLLQACEMADCLSFIQSSVNGIDTIVGDKGIRLSGGQRQRITIARELYRNCEILIFDEATASLDSSSERYIQKSIKKLLGHKTIIIVAHRLSTLKFCDTIFIVQDGGIAERGSWDELLESGGIFGEMCAKQGILPNNKKQIVTEVS